MKIIDCVYNVLLKYPETRDNDGLLYYLIGCDLGYFGLYIDRDSLLKFFSSVSFSSVKRARQILQNRYKELQGTFFKDNKKYNSFTKYCYSFDKYLIPGNFGAGKNIGFLLKH